MAIALDISASVVYKGADGGLTLQMLHYEN
jgi:hypothetical protein